MPEQDLVEELRLAAAFVAAAERSWFGFACGKKKKTPTQMRFDHALLVPVLVDVAKSGIFCVRVFTTFVHNLYSERCDDGPSRRTRVPVAQPPSYGLVTDSELAQQATRRRPPPKKSDSNRLLLDT